MDKRPVTIQDIYKTQTVNGPQISPDGEQVIFSVQFIDREKNRYLSHLYLANIATGKIRQFTQGLVNDQQPRWSPDGQLIAFTRLKDRNLQLWIIPGSGGEAQQLSDLEEGNLGAFCWSPDGMRIAFEYRLTHPDWTQNERKFRKEQNLSTPPRIIENLHYRYDGMGFLDMKQQIWVCMVPSGEVKQLTDGCWDVRDPVWSPDSHSIAMISNRCDDPDSRPFEEDLWVVSTEGGQLQRVGSQEGYKRGLAWSPDGEFLSYIGSETRKDPWGARNDNLWILPILGGTARCLTADLDRMIENVNISDLRGTGDQIPIWIPDSQGLIFLVSDRGNCHIYRVNLHGESEIIRGGEVDISGFRLDYAGEKLVLLASTPDSPTEVYYQDLKSSKNDECLIPLTQLNRSWLDEVKLGRSEEFWFQSFDETDVQGWMIKPPDFDSEEVYPLVLYIHGGPAAQYANTFFHEFQVLAAQGYVVLYSNPRGSLGREERFATCIEGDWGNLDYGDIIAAAEWVEDLAFVDPERMAVAGGSYGGFMVTWILGQTARFRCGISERAVSNRHSAVGTSDFPPMPDGYWAGNPWDDMESLWAQSPLRFAKKIQNPLLIIHSEGDLRCPIGQAEQLFSALKWLKQDVTFVRYPAETSHGLSRNGPPDLRVDRLNRIVDWLERYLK